MTALQTRRLDVSIGPVQVCRKLDLDISAGITHPLDKVIEHQFGFALASTPGTGIKCKYSHFVLL